MKSTSFVRKVDEAGRIVLPKELRKKFHLIENESSLEFFVNEDSIILKKYEPSCMFCNRVEDTVEFEGVKICKNCIEKLNKLK
ncbi:MAG: AbrB/MazE/SpoVT family DNA-binding domain-containing protein [Ruminococcaceae bacterium]|nr:AbrB/MazE/SpoVT family DNA-binding domain-containing protein [Oscillospiraceae bacterium]